MKKRRMMHTVAVYLGLGRDDDYTPVNAEKLRFGRAGERILVVGYYAV